MAQNRDFSLPYLRNIAMTYGMENQNGEAMRRLQKFEDVFIRFDTVHERDRQTDGRTDTA